MYKEPYSIKPPSQDFFGSRLNGSGKWKLHKIVRPFDPVVLDPEEQLEQFNFYQYVGKFVLTEAEVQVKDAALIKPGRKNGSK